MSETAREPDELDQRIRALEAERMRPVPSPPPARALRAAAHDLLVKLQREFEHFHHEEEPSDGDK